jgi:hypothetical protein
MVSIIHINEHNIILQDKLLIHLRHLINMDTYIIHIYIIFDDIILEFIDNNTHLLLTIQKKYFVCRKYNIHNKIYNFNFNYDLNEYYLLFKNTTYHDIRFKIDINDNLNMFIYNNNNTLSYKVCICPVI